ncbi:GNAT family N-acetyltransferase [Shinella sp. G-2]|uniref:GNAT family N-acetyltransferase n=1 Tax=Shinella sp. G-2 TaxID=3133141 RepID=UPI003CFD48B4
MLYRLDGSNILRLKPAMKTLLTEMDIPPASADYILRRVARTLLPGGKATIAAFDRGGRRIGYTLGMNGLSMAPSCRFFLLHAPDAVGDIGFLLESIVAEARMDDRVSLFTEVEEEDRHTRMALEAAGFALCFTENAVTIPVPSAGGPAAAEGIQSFRDFFGAPSLARLASVCHLYRSAYPDVPTSSDVGDIPEEFSLGELQDSDVMPDASFFALDDGHPVGLIQTVRRGGDDAAPNIELVLVSPEYRNRGIGSRLVDAALAALAPQGYREVSSLTWGGNSGMNATFARRGGKTGSAYLTYSLTP